MGNSCCTSTKATEGQGDTVLPPSTSTPPARASPTPTTRATSPSPTTTPKRPPAPAAGAKSASGTPAVKYSKQPPAAAPSAKPAQSLPPTLQAVADFMACELGDNSKDRICKFATSKIEPDRLTSEYLNLLIQQNNIDTIPYVIAMKSAVRCPKCHGVLFCPPPQNQRRTCGLCVKKGAGPWFQCECTLAVQGDTPAPPKLVHGVTCQSCVEALAQGTRGELPDAVAAAIEKLYTPLAGLSGLTLPDMDTALFHGIRMQRQYFTPQLVAAFQLPNDQDALCRWVSRMRPAAAGACVLIGHCNNKTHYTYAVQAEKDSVCKGCGGGVPAVVGYREAKTLVIKCGCHTMCPMCYASHCDGITPELAQSLGRVLSAVTPEEDAAETAERHLVSFGRFLSLWTRLVPRCANGHAFDVSSQLQLRCLSCEKPASGGVTLVCRTCIKARNRSAVSCLMCCHARPPAGLSVEELQIELARLVATKRHLPLLPDVASLLHPGYRTSPGWERLVPTATWNALKHGPVRSSSPKADPDDDVEDESEVEFCDEGSVPATSPPMAAAVVAVTKPESNIVLPAPVLEASSGSPTPLCERTVTTDEEGEAVERAAGAAKVPSSSSLVDTNEKKVVEDHQSGDVKEEEEQQQQQQQPQKEEGRHENEGGEEPVTKEAETAPAAASKNNDDTVVPANVDVEDGSAVKKKKKKKKSVVAEEPQLDEGCPEVEHSVPADTTNTTTVVVNTIVEEAPPSSQSLLDDSALKLTKKKKKKKSVVPDEEPPVEAVTAEESVPQTVIEAVPPIVADGDESEMMKPKKKKKKKLVEADNAGEVLDGTNPNHADVARHADPTAGAEV
eukprot:PhM_4_TR6183/c1_g1_i1/m.100227